MNWSSGRKAANVAHLCLLGSRFGEYNARVQVAIERYPEMLFGLYGVDLDNEKPEHIHEAAARGYRGLKVILPTKRYDHPDYFPIFEAAEENNFVCLFHTGVIGGGFDYRVRDPFDPEVIKGVRPREESRAGRGVSSAHMEPIALDTIAFTFPFPEDHRRTSGYRLLRRRGAHRSLASQCLLGHLRWRDGPPAHHGAQARAIRDLTLQAALWFGQQRPL